MINRLGALALLASVAAPALAIAQGYGAPPPPAPPGAPAPGWSNGPDGHGDWGLAMADHKQRRLKALHDLLEIRPEQEGAFQAYAAALTPPPHAGGWKQDGAGHGHAGPMAPMTTPQRLDRMAQMMDERETYRRAEFERRAAATKALYAALSPEQRRTMDALPALEGHGDHGWDQGGWMGHGPHGDGMAPMGPPPPSGE
jgi:hypothetical protein